MHPRIALRRNAKSKQPDLASSYAQARASMEKLESVIEGMSLTAGLEAMTAYIAGLRELRDILDRAASGDPHARMCLTSIPHAVNGLYLAMEHMVTVQAEASASHE